ncbi:MAG: hypothetical protein VR77_09205 [Flavobacteriales bacterium BRH_c54]|nr:MAG: hypothetical protein VR77_09205 [Flavobacteriales bacterium BRH_c54]
MKKSGLVVLLVLILGLTSTIVAQQTQSASKKINTITKKGDYAILELRLNNEDEFRTIEGSETSLTRISIFTGKNQGAEVIRKGFEGMNTVVEILNDLKSNGWLLEQVYSMKGESLIITHYLLVRKK